MSGENMIRESGTRDRWLIAYWIILLQGLASALPWNVFITETEFFNLRVRQPPFTQVLADNFESINLLTSMAGNMLGFILYVPLHHIMSLDVQVLWPQIMTLGIMMAAVVLTLKESVSGDLFMAVILSSQVALGITNATITGGVYHMASWLPSVYIQGMSLGIGLSGTAVSAISVLTLWAVPRGDGPPSPADVTPAAFSYFLGSTAIVFLAVLTYYVFFMLPYVHSHSIPEVVAEWTAEGKAGVGLQPTNLRRESASFLRCRTRSMSSDSLSASLSRSLSEVEKPLLLHDSYPTARARCAEADEDPPGSLPTWGLHATLPSSIPEDRRSGRSLEAASAPAKASWYPLMDSSSEDEDACGIEAGGAEAAVDSSSGQSEERRAFRELAVRGALLPSLCLQEDHCPGCSCCKQLAARSLTGGVDAEASLGESSRALRDPILANSCLTEADAEASVLRKAEQLRVDIAGDNARDPSLWAVINKLWGYNLVAGLGCMVSMATFPGITSSICSVRNEAVVAPCSPTTPYGRFFGDLFVPFGFLLCNAADVGGRLLAGVGSWSKQPPPMWLLILYSLLRIPVSLLLLFCNVVTPRPWMLPVLFRSDLGTLGVVAVLGATNGHLQSLALMHAPTALPKAAQDRTGPIINFALAAGTTAGSVLSFLFTFYLQRP